MTVLEQVMSTCRTCESQVCCTSRKPEYQTRVLSFEYHQALESDIQLDGELLSYSGGVCHAWESGGCKRYTKFRPLVCHAYPFFPSSEGFVVNMNCPISGVVEGLPKDQRRRLASELAELLFRLPPVARVALQGIGDSYEKKHVVISGRE